MLDLTTEAVRRLPAASLVSEATKMAVKSQYVHGNVGDQGCTFKI